MLQEAAAALRALEAEKAAKEAADARAQELQEMLDTVSAALQARLMCVLLLLAPLLSVCGSYMRGEAAQWECRPLGASHNNVGIPPAAELLAVLRAVSHTPGPPLLAPACVTADPPHLF